MVRAPGRVGHSRLASNGIPIGSIKKLDLITMHKKLDLIKPGGARGHQLTSLAREINDGQDAIAALEDQTNKKAADWLCEISLQGQRLLKIKEIVGHGKWLEWLGSNCPLVSERNAQRYMRAASNPLPQADLDLNGAGTLKQVLKLCADGRGRDPAGKDAPGKSWPTFLEGLGKFSKSVAYAVKHPLSLWPAEGKAKLRETLEPVVRELWPERFA